MSKIRIKLDGLKSQKKTGIAKLYFGDDVLEIPLSLKDDRKTRQVVRLQDHKYLTRLTEEGKFTTTKLVKLSQLKPEYREIIIQSEGFNADHNSFIKLYDENVLDIVADDRNVMQNAVLSIINIDFDYIVDEEKGVYNEDGSLNLNPDSLTVLNDCMLEKALGNAKAYDSFQFVRNGYFCVDCKDSRENAPVFNRIVSLKSSFVLTQDAK